MKIRVENVGAVRDDTGERFTSCINILVLIASRPVTRSLFRRTASDFSAHMQDESQKASSLLSQSPRVTSVRSIKHVLPLSSLPHPH